MLNFHNEKMGENIFLNTISKEETSNLPQIEFNGKIDIIDDPRQIRDACKCLETQRIIGFDTETRPTFRPGAMNRIALLQLSTSDVCFLFRLNKIALDKDIIKILESRNILKIGVDVGGDIRQLNGVRHIKDGGFVDLQQIAPDWGIEDKSLLKLSAIVLGRRISKAQKLSNWEATTLTDKQQMYAATDAWSCVKIYEKLQNTQKIKK